MDRRHRLWNENCLLQWPFFMEVEIEIRMVTNTHLILAQKERDGRCSEFKGFKRGSQMFLLMQAWFRWLYFLSKSSWVCVSFLKFKLCHKYYWLVLDWSVINFVHARKMVLYLRVCPQTFLSLCTAHTDTNGVSPRKENNKNRDLSLCCKNLYSSLL